MSHATPIASTSAPRGKPPAHRLSFGAELQPDGGVHFRVWAPKRSKVEVLFTPAGQGKERAVRLERDDKGGFSGVAPDAGPGTRYRYRLDETSTFPDPASRFQPEGVHGPSEVVDPRAFTWTDDAWMGLELKGLVLYEMHVGTFTPEGTWSSAAEQLPRLAELGITAVELMPVAEFPGTRNWGYDGVDLFAPSRNYGTPDDMRRFVDRAHSLGMGVVLDVVYNHFGPDGAYYREFADEYFHASGSANEWGDSLNFDGPQCEPVRDFFAGNAAYWIAEFHLDGLRLDATQAIEDTSAEHILARIARDTREAAGGRKILLIAENEPQDNRLIKPLPEGGYGLDAMWNDDFHHAAVVALTGRAEAYFCDYQGSAQELASTARWGFLFQGQFTKWQQKRRGSPTRGIAPERLVNFLENHDQVANSPGSQRLVQLSDPGRYRAMTAYWLLLPQTPLLFQGQEFGSTRPFHYFGDFPDSLTGPMREGRNEFLTQFPTNRNPDVLKRIPYPNDESTFLQSKICIEELSRCGDHAFCRLFRDLLRLRRSDPVFRAQRTDWLHTSVLSDDALALRYFAEDGDDRLVLVNLGRDLYPAPATDPLLALPDGLAWRVVWCSEDAEYGGCGTPPLDTRLGWRITGHSTMVLAPAPESQVIAADDPRIAQAYPAGDYQDVHPRLLDAHEKSAHGRADEKSKQP